MATLAAISFTLVGGITIFAVTMALFGCAVKRRQTFIAARCEARPRNVIYNPRPKDPCQDRGDPTLGWMVWVMRLTYDTMLRGIPGTGTRDGGLSGALLKVNLDGIVLLRFHQLCLRVCALAAVLYILVVLPVYITAQCSRIGGDRDSIECLQSNLTDYQRLTLANIPMLEHSLDHDSVASVVRSFFVPQHDGQLARLYAVVFCSWIVTWYALRELRLEWGDVLAMRRVYYLEADLWSDRNEELQETLIRDEHEKTRGRRSPEHNNNCDGDDDDTFSVESDHMTRREPWIPHPEQRDTVPNIELYSVLVGGLPSLPTEVVDPDDTEAVFSRKQSIDWQISVTTAFFDHCVPNQPGFSSSVAAVTILPAASHLTEAWNHWYRAAAKLRRLRYIRRQIADLRRYEIEVDDSDEESAESSKDPKQPPGKNNGNGDNYPRWSTAARTRTTTTTVYTETEQKRMYYQEVLGNNTDLEVENNLLHALNFGPEQTAVYSREFALGAANLAPNGCFEGVINRAGIGELLFMEEQAVKAVHEANQDLRRAQEQIAARGSDGDMSEDDLERIMKKAYSNSGFSIDNTENSGREKRLVSTNHSKLSNDTSHSSLGEYSFAESNDSDEMELPLKDHSSPSIGEIVGGSTRSVPLGSFDDNGLEDDLEANVSAKRKWLLDTFTSKLSNSNHSLAEDREDKNRHARPRATKADFSASQLPRSLGLEAGLWIKQRNLSLGNSQHVPRAKKCPPVRSKSSEGFDFPRRPLSRARSNASDDSNLTGDGNGRPRPPSRLRELREGDLRVRVPPRRAKSSDGIGLIVSSSYNDSPPKRPTRHTTTPKDDDQFDESLVPLQSMQKSHAGCKEQKSDQFDSSSILLLSTQKSLETFKDEVSDEFKKSQDEDTKNSPNSRSLNDNDNAKHTNSSVNSDSNAFWSKLEEDKKRKEKLRAKLSSIQNSTKVTDVAESQQRGPSLATESHLNSAKSSSQNNRSRRDRPLSIPVRGRMADTQNTLGTTLDHRGKSSLSIPPGGAPDAKITLDSSSSHHVRFGRDASSLMTSMNENNAKKQHGDDSSDEESFADDESIDLERASPTQAAYHQDSITQNDLVEENLKIAYNFETTAGLRQKDEESGPRRRFNSISTDKWSKVVTIVQERNFKNSHVTKERMITSGRWRMLSLKEVFQRIWRPVVSTYRNRVKCRFLKQPDASDDWARDSTYAVVTFTSRQAAVAARHCLADSRGADRWVTVSEIPSPPLADAPVCNSSSFRGCVRPVTLSISERQKLIRHQLVLATLVTIYIFYTIPLVAAQALVSPERLSYIFPDIEKWQENSIFLANIFSGFIPALVWTGFFAICPPMFKIISNFGSNATSSVIAENSALHYFWWFMVVSAFTGTSFSTAFVNGFNEGISIGGEIQAVIEQTALAIPTQVSATWLNWMIVRVLIVLPTQYLLQMNTFLFSWLGLPCCARTVRGGGAGGPVPYRIYVDSGVVMLCVFALAPASPLIAAAGFVYFLFCTPLFRWTLIFLYKPKFDIGGQRFPFIFDMCVSGMVVGQILLIAMMSLKAAIGPAIAAFIPMIPTIVHRYTLRRRYLRAFNDAALLQTSLLDGWDTNEESCEDKREEFRRFLVDCHKAAYVPVCIASSDESAMITAEPAVVVPLETDEDIDGESIHDEESMCSEAQKDSTSAKTNAQQPTAITRLSSIQHQNQPGQMLRRLTKQTSLRRLTKQTSLRALTKQTSFRGNLDCDATVTSLQTKDLMSQQYSSPRFMHSPLHTMRRRVVKHDAPSLSIALEAIEQEGVLSGMPRSPIL